MQNMRNNQLIKPLDLKWRMGEGTGLKSVTQITDADTVP